MHRLGRRRLVSVLALSLLVATTALLVQAQVEGKESHLNVPLQPRTGEGRARHSALRSPIRPFLVRQQGPSGDPPADAQSTAGLEPTPIRRLAPTPTPVPLPTPDGVPRRVVVPILMYHHVGVPDSGSDYIRRDLSVTPARFEAQLRYLVERGYQPVTLTDLIMHLQVGSALPAKPVVLTFDDGFEDQYANAYPLLKRYGFVGTFFVITRFADEERPEYMSWSEIELLHASGMEIGSHSYTHPSLAGKSYDYLVWQVLGSREAIEARTQDSVRFFSYPSGQYDQLTIDVLKSAGYWGAVTVEAGSLQSAEAPFEMKRIRVRGTYDLKDFDHWLNHWLAHP